MGERRTWEQVWDGTNFGRYLRADNTDGDERLQRALGSRYRPEPEPALVSCRRITSDCGWLSPDGRWHPCCEEGHKDCAQLILDSLEPGKWTGPEREHFGGYERELERRGYVKLSGEWGIYAADESRVTPRQKRLLVNWLTSDANEHTTWPWWLEPGDSA